MSSFNLRNNGTFAEYLKIPAPIVQHNLLPVPDQLPSVLAAMTEPLDLCIAWYQPFWCQTPRQSSYFR